MTSTLPLKSFVLLLISCFSLAGLVYTNVSFGTWRVISWLTFALLGVRVLEEYGIYHHTLLLPILCECLLICDEVCRRSINFVFTV